MTIYDRFYLLKARNNRPQITISEAIAPKSQITISEAIVPKSQITISEAIAPLVPARSDDDIRSFYLLKAALR